MWKFISTVIFTLCFIINANSQTAEDFLTVGKMISTEQSKKTSFRHFENHVSKKNELDLIFSGAFLFYKNFVSSQDWGTCSFHPSCSEYGMLAVKENGIIKGVIHTCDRLMRCNSLSPGKYTIDAERRKLYDPID